MKTSKKKPQAEGYAEGVELLYSKRPVSDFVMAPDGLAFLANVSELSLGTDDANAATWLKHKSTTPEIQELIKDIKGVWAWPCCPFFYGGFVSTCLQ